MDKLSDETRYVLAKLKVILDTLDDFGDSVSGLDAANHIKEHLPELQKLSDPNCNPKKLTACECIYDFRNSNRNFCYYCNAPVVKSNLHSFKASNSK